MLRRLRGGLAPFVLLLLAAAALPAQDLEVVFIDVGQGDSTLITGPTGKTFLLDGGSWNEGYNSVVPVLNARGINHLDYVGATHYHSDHVGGLDEVWNSGIHATVALDRGNSNTPGTQSYNEYASAFGGVRQTAVPGQVVDLGGGATMTCLVVEGALMGGGSVNISNSAQWENSASIAWRLDYGDFQLFLGGDLTGGGNGTTDLETHVGPLCGDVDVYQLNHHGSRTSSNSTFLGWLQPEFAVIPCGHANSYGFPKQEVVDRLSYAGRTIPVWSVTDGVGTEGFVDAGGSIVLTTDGTTYTVVAPGGHSFTAWCDEAAPTPAGAGDAVVAEFMRDPAKVADADGEWLEVTGARVSEPVSLAQVVVTDLAGDSFTIAAPIRLAAGDECLLAADGLGSRNGGIAPVLVWPLGSMDLVNSADTIRLQRSASVLDQVDYGSGWPGGAGVSAERIDLLGGTAAGNFAAAVASYGLGDKGTPGADNSADNTNWNGGGGVRVEIVTPPVLGQLMEMNWYAPGEAGMLYQGWITLSTTPGFDLNGTHIPGNLDAGFNATAGLPGWSGFVPGSEVMPTSMVVPNNPSLAGRQVWALFATYQDILGQGIVVREIGGPEPMTIQ
ncbi:MAG: MBL fold metallo-hydrolase [Planctomycetota bacterium]|nr:MAG: MBL fold metallo-hydrolase [Planctomycetota bacterium]